MCVELFMDQTIILVIATCQISNKFLRFNEKAFLDALLCTQPLFCIDFCDISIVLLNLHDIWMKTNPTALSLKEAPCALDAWTADPNKLFVNKLCILKYIFNRSRLHEPLNRCRAGVQVHVPFRVKKKG